MTGKTRIIAILLLGVGLIFLALAFFSGQDVKKSSEAIETEIKRIEVVVPVVRLQFGQPITAGQLETLRVAVAPSGAFKNPSDLIGKKPIYTIEAGTPITRQFFEPGAVAAQLREGYRAFALGLDDNSASTGKIKAGDFVDVFSLFRSKNKEVEQTISRMVLPKLRVLSVGEQLVNSPEAAEEKDDPRDRNRRRNIRAVMVEVATADINTLALAQDQGQLFVVIRNPEDESMPDLEKYPQPQPVLQPRKELTATANGPKEAPVPLELTDADKAFAGLAFEDAVLPGSAAIQTDPKAQNTNKQSATKRSYSPPPTTVEVIRAGEATRENAR